MSYKLMLRPGDLDNKNNGFAGRFSGYDTRIQNPYDAVPSELPVILVVGDSIISEKCVSCIRAELRGAAHVNALQQPHHCKNIASWLDAWRVHEWGHYHCVFWFDGMHGFPERVTESEFRELTPVLVSRIRANIPRILWCNCTPIPDNMPQGHTNSRNGPNSKQQRLTDTSVQHRNESIQAVMSEMRIECLDLYKELKPIQSHIQPHNDIHFTEQGQVMVGKLIADKLRALFL